METIRSSNRISELFSSGDRLVTPFVILIYQSQTDVASSDEVKHDLPGRVAFIAGKKLGNAVWRNKAKRRLRALCYELHGPWSGFDVIFLAKSALTSAKYSKVLQACRKALDHSPLNGMESHD